MNADRTSQAAFHDPETHDLLGAWTAFGLNVDVPEGRDPYVVELRFKADGAASASATAALADSLEADLASGDAASRNAAVADLCRCAQLLAKWLAPMLERDPEITGRYGHLLPSVAVLAVPTPLFGRVSARYRWMMADGIDADTLRKRLQPVLDEVVFYRGVDPNTLAIASSLRDRSGSTGPDGPAPPRSMPAPVAFANARPTAASKGVPAPSRSTRTVAPADLEGAVEDLVRSLETLRSPDRARRQSAVRAIEEASRIAQAANLPLARRLCDSPELLAAGLMLWIDSEAKSKVMVQLGVNAFKDADPLVEPLLAIPATAIGQYRCVAHVVIPYLSERRGVAASHGALFRWNGKTGLVLLESTSGWECHEVDQYAVAQSVPACLPPGLSVDVYPDPWQEERLVVFPATDPVEAPDALLARFADADLNETVSPGRTGPGTEHTDAVVAAIAARSLDGSRAPSVLAALYSAVAVNEAGRGEVAREREWAEKALRVWADSVGVRGAPSDVAPIALAHQDPVRLEGRSRAARVAGGMITDRDGLLLDAVARECANLDASDGAVRRLAAALLRGLDYNAAYLVQTLRTERWALLRGEVAPALTVCWAKRPSFVRLLGDLSKVPFARVRTGSVRDSLAAFYTATADADAIALALLAFRSREPRATAPLLDKIVKIAQTSPDYLTAMQATQMLFDQAWRTVDRGADAEGARVFLGTLTATAPSDPRTAGVLTRALARPDTAVRVYAAHQLRRHFPELAVGMPDDIEFAAASDVEDWLLESAHRLLSAWGDVSRPFPAAAARFLAAGLGQVFGAGRDRPGTDPRSVAFVLEQIGDRARGTAARRVVMTALGGIGSPVAAEAGLHALERDDEQAVLALAGCVAPMCIWTQGLQFLERLLESGSPAAQRAALRSLRTSAEHDERSHNFLSAARDVVLVRLGGLGPCDEDPLQARLQEAVGFLGYSADDRASVEAVVRLVAGDGTVEGTRVEVSPRAKQWLVHRLVLVLAQNQPASVHALHDPDVEPIAREFLLGLVREADHREARLALKAFLQGAPCSSADLLENEGSLFIDDTFADAWTPELGQYLASGLDDPRLTHDQLRRVLAQALYATAANPNVRGARVRALRLLAGADYEVPLVDVARTFLEQGQVSQTLIAALDAVADDARLRDDHLIQERLAGLVRHPDPAVARRAIWALARVTLPVGALGESGGLAGVVTWLLESGQPGSPPAADIARLLTAAVRSDGLSDRAVDALLLLVPRALDEAEPLASDAAVALRACLSAMGRVAAAGLVGGDSFAAESAMGLFALLADAEIDIAARLADAMKLAPDVPTRAAQLLAICAGSHAPGAVPPAIREMVAELESLDREEGLACIASRWSVEIAELQAAAAVDMGSALADWEGAEALAGAIRGLSWGAVGAPEALVETLAHLGMSVETRASSGEQDATALAALATALHLASASALYARTVQLIHSLKHFSDREYPGGVRRLERLLEVFSSLTIVDVADAAEYLSALVARLSAKTGAPEMVTLDEELDQVVAMSLDEARLDLALENLLANAVRAARLECDADGVPIPRQRGEAHVEVGLARAGDELRISVTDNGPGFTDLAAIRERLDKVTWVSGAKDVAGSPGGARFGIGLGVVQQAVSEIGGRFTLENIREDGVIVGARTTITLPIGGPE